MTGRTHVSVGIASALVVTKPKGLGELTICIGTALIGALISDIDVSSTKSHKIVERLCILGMLIAAFTAYMEYSWKIGLMYIFSRDSNGFRLVTGAALFLVVCAYGKEQPHRSFMHSFLALGILTGVVYLMLPAAAACFAVAMCSHMVIDTLNYKKVQLFYPIRHGISMKLCHATGVVNTFIGYSALLIVVLECVAVIK